MFDLYDIFIIIGLSLLAGIVISAVCLRLWLYLTAEPAYTESDDTPDEDWVMDCYKSAEGWKDEH